MQLDRLSFVVRPRPDWGAIDLGFSLARTWWVPMCLRGGILLLPWLILACTISNLFWAIVLLWWFKPIYERLPLYYLGSAVFREPGSFLEMLNKVVDAQLLLSLTVFRFSWRRSAVSAICLEDGRYHDLARRRKVLYRDGAGSLFWLGFLGFWFELVLSVVVFQSITTFFEISENATTDARFLDDDVVVNTVLGFRSIFVDSTFAERVVYLTILSGCMLCTLPFYVASGFSLYLNRRTILEGWDIEVGFKKLIQRLGLLTLCLVLIVPADIHAQEPVDHETAIEEVRNSPDFNHERTVKIPIVLKYLRDWLNEQEVTSSATKTPTFFKALALLAEIAFWIAVLALFAYFVYRIIQLMDITAMRPSKRTRAPPPQVVEQDPLTTLAEDILPLVLAAWEQKDVRRAFSLLYLGSLRHLKRNLGCDISVDQTESECLRRTRHLDSDLNDAFRRITLLWQRVAYAGDTVTNDQFEQSLNEFRTYFHQA